MEDIAYLKEHAQEESFLFVVDSAKRNKHAYPEPNEYAIEFDKAFTNVFGFDLLHATIPRTEYTVDLDHNMLVYSVHGEEHILIVEPGDYNLVQLCDVMNTDLQGMACEPHSAPYQLRSRIRFYSMHAFAIDTARSTLTQILGFYDTYAVHESSFTGLVEQRTYQGPYAGLDYVELEENQVIRQPFVPSISGTCSKIHVQLASDSAEVECRIVDESDNVLGTALVSGSSNSEVAIQDGLMLAEGMQYYIEITATASGTGVYRNLPLDGGTVAERQVIDSETEEVTWVPLDSVDCLSCDVFVMYNRYQIEGPGLVDLTGERHVIVRCDEIESHFHRGRKTETFHGGVGMVRMGANGFQDQRFDFVTFPSQRLADPIGKLKTMTFRLTKPNGKVYNTRGVDHTLLCVIKYYVMVQRDTTPSISCPEYTPNVTQFLAARWIQESEEKDALRMRHAQRTEAYKK